MKNVVWGFLILIGLIVGFTLLGEKPPPPPTQEQKLIGFAKQDFEDCMSKFNSMSERERFNSGIGDKCMALRNKFEAMDLEARLKKN
jgi:hypothetical protein